MRSRLKRDCPSDPSSWDLIGFTDLDNSESDITSDSSMSESSVRENLATHVLQFYFKSVFSGFQFPCSYFLARGISAHNLNRIFWQGVSLLHSFNFEVLIACCDGAAENRAFMVMNGCSESVSKVNNPFSNYPLIFMSDFYVLT